MLQKVADFLLDQNIEIIIVEPNIGSLPDILKKRCKLQNVEETLEIADLAIILVVHKQFNTPNHWQKFRGKILDYSYWKNRRDIIKEVIIAGKVIPKFLFIRTKKYGIIFLWKSLEQTV